MGFNDILQHMQFFTKLQTSLILLASVRGVLQTQPDVSDEGNVSKFTDTRIDITLHAIGFSYEADQTLFDGGSMINFAERRERHRPAFSFSD